MRLPWLTDNFVLKIFSLAAALLLSMFVNSQSDQPVEVEFPIEYRTAEDILIISDPPRKALVTLVGPWASLRSLVWPNREPIVVDLGRRGPGEERVRLDGYDVHAPNGMTVANIAPAAIEVALDRRIEKMVPVEPDVTGRLPFGYEIGEVRVDPTRVRVAGPRSRVQLIDRIYTRAIDLTDRTTDIQENVALRPPAQLSQIVDREVVSLSVSIREEVIERRFKDVEVKASEAEARLTPPRVSFAIHGPRKVVEQLDPASLEVVVQVQPEAQKQERFSKAVEIRALPPRVAVLGEPPLVEIQLRRRKP